MKSGIKSSLKTVIKLAFAALILTWLIKNGKLDFGLVGETLQHPVLLASTISLILCQIMISAWRWRKLVQLKTDSKLPLFPIIKLTWIGLFFSSVLPGAVTGDIIKVVFARNLDKKLSKTYLIMSVFMDRIIGLIGLLFLLGAFSAYSYSELAVISPHLRNLIHFNFLLFIGVFFFLVSLFLPVALQQFILKLTAKIPFLGQRIGKTLEQVWIMGQSKKTIIQGLGASLISQFINILAFWIISSPFYEQAIPLRYVFTFMPVGLMAVAVPISPAGLGVGHAIFDGLFKLFGTHNGASLFNIYFLVIVSINLLGLIPYLTYKSHKTINLEQELSDTEATKNFY